MRNSFVGTITHAGTNQQGICRIVIETEESELKLMNTTNQETPEQIAEHIVSIDGRLGLGSVKLAIAAAIRAERDAFAIVTHTLLKTQNNFLTERDRAEKAERELAEAEKIIKDAIKSIAHTGDWCSACRESQTGCEQWLERRRAEK